MSFMNKSYNLLTLSSSFATYFLMSLMARNASSMLPYAMWKLKSTMAFLVVLSQSLNPAKSRIGTRTTLLVDPELRLLLPVPFYDQRKLLLAVSYVFISSCLENFKLALNDSLIISSVCFNFTDLG